MTPAIRAHRSPPPARAERGTACCGSVSPDRPARHLPSLATLWVRRARPFLREVRQPPPSNSTGTKPMNRRDRQHEPTRRRSTPRMPPPGTEHSRSRCVRVLQKARSTSGYVQPQSRVPTSHSGPDERRHDCDDPTTPMTWRSSDRIGPARPLAILQSWAALLAADGSRRRRAHGDRRHPRPLRQAPRLLSHCSHLGAGRPAVGLLRLFARSTRSVSSGAGLASALESSSSRSRASTTPRDAVTRPARDSSGSVRPRSITPISGPRALVRPLAGPPDAAPGTAPPALAHPIASRRGHTTPARGVDVPIAAPAAQPCGTLPEVGALSNAGAAARGGPRTTPRSAQRAGLRSGRAGEPRGRS